MKWNKSTCRGCKKQLNNEDIRVLAMALLYPNENECHPKMLSMCPNFNCIHLASNTTHMKKMRFKLPPFNNRIGLSSDLIHLVGKFQQHFPKEVEWVINEELNTKKILS
jgi:hypothetical protein